LRRLVVESQDVGRELVHTEHPLDAPMADRDAMARLDDPREFMGGEGVGECQADNLWLDLRRHTRFDRWLAAGMGEGPAIEEADNPRVLKASEILPESVIGDARDTALLGERGLALEDGAQDVIAG
jgi:hypothetical protein